MPRTSGPGLTPWPNALGSARALTRPRALALGQKWPVHYYCNWGLKLPAIHLGVLCEEYSPSAVIFLQPRGGPGGTGTHP